MDKNRKTLVLFVIFGIIIMVVGTTLAYFRWQSAEEQKTVVNFTIGSDFSCAADGGGDITSGTINLVPTEVNDNTTDNYIKRAIKVMPTIDTSGKTIYMDLWLDIKSISANLSSSSNLMYVLNTSSTDKDTGVVISGNFNGKPTGDKVELLNSKEYSATVTETYYLWIWLDAKETSSSTMNQSFSLSLNGTCIDNSTDKTAPELDRGMIPVVISNDGTVTTILKDDSNWYNYDEKKWANIVLVNSSSRRDYLNTTGIVIPEDDILAYYVWIPRYKYKIWETGMSSAGKEQEIEIVFETKDTDKSTGTQVGEYRTHPAFTFGDVELAGIWVGKFETTGTADSPTIKGNSISLTRQSRSEQFTTSQLFSGTTYGSNLRVDSHVMKNSEWGAVAYLSHSKYGINGEIKRNNYSAYDEFLTGCGVDETATGSSTTCVTAYGSATEYLQSTTGNITGIFDMVGGTDEFVMAYYSQASSTWGAASNGDFAGFSSKPDSKYYDEYVSTDPLTACYGELCYGHALSETANWYNNVAIFVDESYPWLDRGGYALVDVVDEKLGIFVFAYTDGGAAHLASFRSVLSPIGA